MDNTTLTVELPKSFQQALINAITAAVQDTVAKTPTKDTGGWIGLEQACQYLQVSRATLNRFIEKQGLHVSIIKGVKRMKRSDLDKFMEDHSY